MTSIEKRIENLEERNQQDAEGPMTISIIMHRADGPRTIICGGPEEYHEPKDQKEN